jgi:hypothetical protein
MALFLLSAFLLDHITSPEDLKVWECCCGKNQNMVKALKMQGYTNIVASDVCKFDGSESMDFQFDLLGEETFEDYNMVITNPPFKLKRKILERMYQKGKPFALLLPISILGTKYFKKIAKEHRGTVIIPLAPKVTFMKDNKAVQVGEVAWFVWGLPDLMECQYTAVVHFVDRPQNKDTGFVTEDEMTEFEQDEDTEIEDNEEAEDIEE